MQRARTGAVQAGVGSAEAEILRWARAGGAKAPEVLVGVSDPNPLERDFTIVRRIAGESIPRRILSAAQLGSAREKFVGDCVRELAAIHALDISDLRGLMTTVDDRVEFQRNVYESFDDPHPVFDLVLRWLAVSRPPEAQSCVVHGNFRCGRTRSIEMALVGRRIAEVESDALSLLPELIS